MIRTLQVSDIMTKKLITFKPDTHVMEAIATLVENKISGAPVVDEQNHLVGMLSEIDCMQTLIQSTYHNEIGGLVKEYMSEEVNTIPSNMGLIDLAEYFLETHFRRLPVVDNGKLVGQVSRRDVLRAIQKIK